jgi:hypothetical protein
MWLRADAGLPSGAGDFWADQSGTGNHGYQVMSGATAKLGQDSVSGLPALTFDGSDDFFSFTAPPAGQQLTVFWVVGESTAATRSVRRSLLGDAGNNTFLGGPGAPGIIWDSAASSLVRSGQTRVDGAPVPESERRPRKLSVVSLVTAPTTGSIRADRFGTANLSAGWYGDLAELIVYDTALSAEDRLAIERYLGARYGIAVP